MAVSMTPTSLFRLSSLLLLYSMVCDGFSLKLIHRDSIESPFYPGNLTFEKRLERLHQQSMVRLNQIVSEIETSITTKGANESDSIHPNLVGPPVMFNGQFYLARVGIGTFPTQPTGYMSYYLLVDTGSMVTWIQCDGATGFHQIDPLFPFTTSSSFQYLTCQNHAYCQQQPNYCFKGICAYKIQYANSAYSEGLYGTETFTFESDNYGNPETIPGLVFGCGNIQKDFNFHEPNRIAGILGLGSGFTTSFLDQIVEKPENHGLFSYCLQPEGTAFLRFGNDARFHVNQGISTTRLLATQHYFIPLEGISVAGVQLNFPPGYFARTQDGRGGCLLDSGTRLTVIPRIVYQTAILTMVSYFNRHLPIVNVDGWLLCFYRPADLHDFPNMVYHFEGNAILEIAPEELFLMAPLYFCPTMVPHDFTWISVIIGGRQQANHRFVFDIHNKVAQFAREQCV